MPVSKLYSTVTHVHADDDVTHVPASKTVTDVPASKTVTRATEEQESAVSAQQTPALGGSTTAWPAMDGKM